jgi:hypothetical protein
VSITFARGVSKGTMVMPITTSYGMSYGWTKNSIAPSRFSFISRCFFCKIYKADSDVQAPFLVAESRLPSEFTGGMLILFQLDHRHPEFPAQVSGADGNHSTGQLESLAKDFRNKLSWRIGLLLQFHRLGTLSVSFHFPPTLFF